MFIGSHKKNVDLSGYISRGLLDPLEITERHQELVDEMQKRGYNHNSPIDEVVAEAIAEKYGDVSLVDIEANVLDLAFRCDECREMLLNGEI